MTDNGLLYFPRLSSIRPRNILVGHSPRTSSSILMFSVASMMNTFVPKFFVSSALTTSTLSTVKEFQMIEIASLSTQIIVFAYLFLVSLSDMPKKRKRRSLVNMSLLGAFIMIVLMMLQIMLTVLA